MAGGRSYRTGDTGWLDAGLQRIYDRIGLGLITLYIVVIWAAAAGVAIASGAGIGWILELSGSETARLIGIVLVSLLVGCLIAIAGVRRASRPLAGWLAEGPGSPHAEDAWCLANELPVISQRWNLVLGFILTNTASVVALNQIADLDVDDTIVAAVVIVGLWALINSGGLFTAQLALRPVLRDAFALVADRRPPPIRGTSMSVKLVILIPIWAAVLTGFGALASLSPGDDIGDVMPTLFAAMGVGFVFAAPVMILLGLSTLTPLRDLLAATERIKRGDYSTPVPPLSHDEHGMLAHSFNDAMDGLAERRGLAAANRELLDEVMASRARLVAASDAERRRIERNIHDGAQQRLVSLALRLRVLQKTADSGVQAGLNDAVAELNAALAELRELATGLHPTILGADGLRAALEHLARKATVPVTVDAPPDRYEEAVESTAYYLCSEALTNVAKYASASCASISVERRNGFVVVEVADDGVGGAAIGRGTGLVGLADRVAALDGALTIDSPAGGGTRLRAELPV